ncbi:MULTISPECIES: ABC transporter ATP-binding protein [Halorussus]|uniref:ABC transporter ATP-binding protein n=1 Tax=Halorussus TaxID=1070314 RepID=UPI000E214829|nr:MULTISPECIES: ABC transporter ATP-binding protein [Halorussus]NHN58593.1 ABC transporter ATP-binding protein [Halorussus sp. JP-T4]
MTRIEVESLTKQFGPVTAVDGISFDVEGEEFLSIVGPSGCGKTTTLRCIAGLETPSGGRIRYDGADVTDVPVNERNIAMMFQSIALYPHMTLRNNIGYPLKVSGVPRNELNDEVEAAAEVMQIDEDLDKYPGELSGGQQQRVALARTVVGDSVALLMDEPLSDLDAKLKVEIRKEIQRIHGRIGEPAIYVTHDQEEAMTMSDRIVVMNEGRIEQIGDVDEVYDYPNNRFVAEFIGNPSMNFVTGSLSELSDATATVEIEENEIAFDVERLADGRDGGVTVGVRPQNVSLSGEGVRAFAGTIRLLEPIGDRTLATIDGPQGELSALIPRDAPVAEGEETEIYFDSAELYLFDPESTTLIARSS